MKRQGFTLAELTITIALTFLLGMCVFLVIMPSFRIAAEGQIRTELQQQGQLALQQVTTDLQGSVSNGVTLIAPSGSQGMIMACHPLSASTQLSGLPSFTPKLQVWWHDLAKTQLWRRNFVNGNPPTGLTLAFETTQPLKPTNAQLISIVSATSPGTKSYALSVIKFEVDQETASGGEIYALRIVLSKVIPGKKANAVVELFRKVMQRNHY
ncbi:MAG: hypothetical protein KF760_14340 [Candidatus Eremiobacteraeota bacterium]|nr:hypothetical protein [Candidatus Eremiobacteraeota bacterium]MCW5868265.1 hypothetical protein [Candidatus Eremiobacteraeota bacterium]